MKTKACILVALIATAIAFPLDAEKDDSSKDDEIMVRSRESIPYPSEPDEITKKDNNQDGEDIMVMAGSETMKCCNEMGIHEHVDDHHVDNEEKTGRSMDDEMDHGKDAQGDESKDSYVTALMDEGTTPETMDDTEMKTRKTELTRDFQPPPIVEKSLSYRNPDKMLDDSIVLIVGQGAATPKATHV